MGNFVEKHHAKLTTVLSLLCAVIVLLALILVIVKVLQDPHINLDSSASVEVDLNTGYSYLWEGEASAVGSITSFRHFFVYDEGLEWQYESRQEGVIWVVTDLELPANSQFRVSEISVLELRGNGQFTLERDIALKVLLILFLLLPCLPVLFVISSFLNFLE